MRKTLKLPSGLNSKLVGLYQANGFLFTPDLYFAQVLPRLCEFIAVINNP